MNHEKEVTNKTQALNQPGGLGGFPPTCGERTFHVVSLRITNCVLLGGNPPKPRRQTFRQNTTNHERYCAYAL